jgi:cytoplasmic iron level regulating protein YaaA (DUF328/UPF0246 family)
MAGWIVANRVRSTRSLREFTELDYRYDPTRSTPAKPVFVR